MARMFPEYEKELNSCYAESKAYKALKELPQEYMIFHSVAWVEKKEYNPFRWYENDFLIIHPTYGMLVLEVKGGEIRFEDGIVYITVQGVVLRSNEFYTVLVKDKNGNVVYEWNEELNLEERSAVKLAIDVKQAKKPPQVVKLPVSLSVVGGER